MKKRCPTCGRRYSEIEMYCTKCGIELAKEPNRCSAMKTAMCRERTFKDDDLYCSFCGSPTIYAKEMLEEKNRW